QPLSPLHLNFNNRLDPDACNAKSIKVSPRIPQMKIRIANSSIVIAGLTRGRTTYRVTLPPDLTDVHGQTLGSTTTRAFRFGSARPMLMAPGGSFRVLDPQGKRAFVIHSMNYKDLDLEIYRVLPKDWPAYATWRRRGMRKKVPDKPPGELLTHKVIHPQGAPDALIRTAIDLQPAFGKNGGQVVVLVKEHPLPEKPWLRHYVTAWLQATDLALDAFVDHGRLLAWVTRLADGKPVKGAAINLGVAGPQGTTDATGIARLGLDNGGAPFLTARMGGKTVMLPKSLYSTSGWRRRPAPRERVRWYVFDDRKLYRPKETVHVKGWVRLVHMGKKSGVRLLPSRPTQLTYEVYGPRRNKIGKGKTTVGKLGGFHLTFKLPDAVNLGRARLRLSLDSAAAFGASTTHRFRIQEFRRPEFEVAAQSSSGPHFIGGHGQFTIKASYFSGGPLANADVTWNVTATKGSFTPPKQSGYTFGDSSPSWWRYRASGLRTQAFKTRTQSFNGMTGARGKHRLRLDFDAIHPAQPAVLRGSATVRDINRQTWTAKTRLLVHPAALYVGLKTKRYFIKRGKPLDVQAIVSDLDGKLVAGTAIALSAARVTWGYEKGRYRSKEVDPQTCTKTSKATPITCTFSTTKGGTYLIRATIKDHDGRPNRTSMTRWVSGGKRQPERMLRKETVRLIADKKRYLPGETAEILVRSPFENAEGLLTILRGGILEERRFAIEGMSKTLTITLDERAMPNLAIRVDLVGKSPRVDRNGVVVPKIPTRPAYASGTLSLPVSTRSRKLKIDVEPKHPSASPGTHTAIDVTVRDAGGKALPGAGVALIVVDESVLALTGYRLANPLYTFYPTRPRGLSAYHLRRYVRLDDPIKLLKKLSEGDETTKDKLR
ncbi:MAG: hypothetical protein DRH04_11000, partial [Deltaproteobacteria bacterium]